MNIFYENENMLCLQLLLNNTILCMPTFAFIYCYLQWTFHGWLNMIIGLRRNGIKKHQNGWMWEALFWSLAEMQVLNILAIYAIKNSGIENFIYLFS